MQTKYCNRKLSLTYNRTEMKKIITIKIEVNTNHPACEEWQKKKDFVCSEIDEVLDRIRDFTRPYKKESGKSLSKATIYSVNIQKLSNPQNGLNKSIQ